MNDPKIDFLLERIKEDEWIASQSFKTDQDWVAQVNYPLSVYGMSGARVLRECAAKRAIIELHKQWPILIEGPYEYDFPAINDMDDLLKTTYSITQKFMWANEQEYIKRFGTAAPTAPMIDAMLQIYSTHSMFKPEWKI